MLAVSYNRVGLTPNMRGSDLASKIAKGRAIAQARRASSSVPVNNEKAGREMRMTFNDFAGTRAAANRAGL